MKISKNWLNEFIDLSAICTEKLCKTLNSIGLEVDACTAVRMPKSVVVGKIISCEKHPDADKLSICQVDVGANSSSAGEKTGASGELVQIVCGAKNAREGLLTAVALPGAQIGEICIKRAKLRGVESCGMCCSAAELGLPKINDGIIELDSSLGEFAPGTPLADIAAFNDDLIEIELTANRGDCLSLHGIARDLSAALDVPLKAQPAYKDDENAIGIRRQVLAHYAENLNTHFCMKAAVDEQHFAAPLLMQMRLALVDKLCATGAQNHLAYATHAMGVLMYGIDMDKLEKGAEQYALQILPLANGESEVKFASKRLAVASVLCEEQFAADETTTRLLIMAHYTHPEIIARCHKNYKNADVYHSFRGSEPALELGLNYLCNNLNAHVLAGTSSNAANDERKNITFTINELERLIGQSCEKNDVVRILKRLGFELSFAQDYLSVSVPAFRHDISNSADICEEIVRIIGIDNIAAAPLAFSEANRTNDVLRRYQFARKLRERALMQGYFESVGYVFESSEFLAELGMADSAPKLLNPITAEMNTLRPAIFTTLLKHAAGNFANGKKGVKLYEIGEIYEGERQARHLGLIASGVCKAASIKNGAKPAAVAFFDVLGDIKNIIGNFSLSACENKIFSEYERASVVKNGRKIGEVGRLDLALEDALNLPKTYIFEADFALLDNEFITAREYSKLPGTSRDLSLLVPRGYDYAQLRECINALRIPTLKGFKITDLYRDESLAERESLSVNFEFSDPARQLKNDDVNAEMEQIIAKLAELGINIR